MESAKIQFEHKPSEQLVDVLVNGDLFTQYRYPDEVAKPILYPLITTTGKNVTRGFPINPSPGERADHPHHIGHWLNYGDVNGLDFWNNSGQPAKDRLHKYGFIKHKDLKIDEENGSLEVNMEWQNFKGEVLLKEKTAFLFDQIGSNRLITRVTTLSALNDSVSFDDNKEGMIAIRVARALELPSSKPAKFITQAGVPSSEKVIDETPVTGNYISSNGLSGNKVWGTRGKWVQLSGKLEEDPVNIVIFDHPDNIGYPTYWHARGYGLFAANPLGQKVFSKGKEVLRFQLAPHESITFKYRLLIQGGAELQREQVEAEFERFIEAK